MVTISNSTVVEGIDRYLVSNLSLPQPLPFGQLLTLELATEDGTARGGTSVSPAAAQLGRRRDVIPDL